MADRARLVERRAQDLPRARRAPPGWWTLQAGLLAQRAQLLARRRAVDVGGDQQRMVPALASQRPSLAVVVVLPEPCRPAIRTTEGSRAEVCSRGGSSPPSSATISSRTTRSTAWAGVRLLRTSWPVARTRTRSRNCLTTLKWTSASSRARRISRSAASTSASREGTPGPRRVPEDPLQLVAQRFEHVGLALGRARSARTGTQAANGCRSPRTDAGHAR